jgi:hypothetical protein
MLVVQIFGPCAMPFSVEKQTLLREALAAVLDRVIDIYIIRVSQVLASLALCIGGRAKGGEWKGQRTKSGEWKGRRAKGGEWLWAVKGRVKG